MNRIFLHGEVVSTSLNPQAGDHTSLAVRDCLFNLFAATLLTGGRSSIRNLRTRRAVVTWTHYMDSVHLHKKAIAAERNHIVFTSNIRVDRMAGCGSVTGSSLTCRRQACFVTLLSVASV